MSTISPDVVVDAKGLISPMPVLKAKKAIDRLGQGQVLSVIADDATTPSDISILVERLGLELLRTIERRGTTEFYIRKP
jgi:TusA-related sulfurtransferase